MPPVVAAGQYPRPKIVSRLRQGWISTVVQRELAASEAMTDAVVQHALAQSMMAAIADTLLQLGFAMACGCATS